MSMKLNKLHFLSSNHIFHLTPQNSYNCPSIDQGKLALKIIADWMKNEGIQ